MPPGVSPGDIPGNGPEPPGFETSISLAQQAIDNAESEIRDAWGPVPVGLEICVELVDQDRDSAFFQVTLSGPHANEIAAAVNKMLED